MKYFLIFTFLLSFTLVLKGQSIINPCAQNKDIHVVVLGSSTAAGSGPSSADSAWVNRYRKYLKGINSNNQVTNLAVGGTTTYFIMPTWFIPPTGRPFGNPSRNVSAAISLGADAIIVNMPSNDAANNFSIIEQMHNFITISQTADSAGIPVWVCTTQPRNGFNAAQKAIQVGVKDSIISYFGNKAIDFWNGFADPNDNLLSMFDSGDGVHMNDVGHKELNQRVIAKAIPNEIADTLSYTDHRVSKLYIENSSFCGDSNMIVKTYVTNVGPLFSTPISVVINTTDLSTNSSWDTTINLANPISPCANDTISYSLNTFGGVDYKLRAHLITQDSIKTNDTSDYYNLVTYGKPSIDGENDTICAGEVAILTVSNATNQDSIVWFDSLSGGDVIDIGRNISLSNLTSSKTFFASAVRGGLTYSSSLFTTSTTTTNWNGHMFDIIADDSLIIDSLTCKINSIGNQAVVIYRKMGSYQGSEGNASAWQLWNVDSINVINAGDQIMLNIPSTSINAGDTMGVYLHMQNSASTLSYQSAAQWMDFIGDGVRIHKGSGIGYTFNGVFSPRLFSGEIFYRYGFNPEGKCSSPRISVTAVVSNPEINLGNDTTISEHSSILLRPDSSFEKYLWSDASVGKNLFVDINGYGIGPNDIWLEVKDAFNCKASDTIQVTFGGYSGVNNYLGEIISVYPNPFGDYLNLRILHDNEEVQVEIINLAGQLVYSDQLNLENETKLDLRKLESGLYLLKISSDSFQSQIRIIKS